jgi:hypothetical protein
MGKKEDNLKKLAKAGILTSFVKKAKGQWNHDGWLELLALIRGMGYTPIDKDQVGLLLEQNKAEYLAKSEK